MPLVLWCNRFRLSARIRNTRIIIINTCGDLCLQSSGVTDLDLVPESEIPESVGSAGIREVG